ncbi:MAG: hypothetical protein AAB554_02800 [Patescibacteria group bacterium]
MRKRARDPLTVAILIFSLLLVTLMLFLLTAVVRKKTPAAAPTPATTPFIPPGWVNPTSPPPTAERTAD